MKKPIILLVCVVFMLAACGAPSTSQPASSQDPTSSAEEVLSGIGAENYPRINGSTANLPLMATLYAKICDVPPETAESFVPTNVGTAEAWRSIMYGESDLLIVYEAPENINQQLKESGVKLDITPLGRDGLVFLANTANKVDNLSRQQLRDIYSGKITDWSGVGGDPGPIAAYQRNAESGSQTLFLKLLMQDIQTMKPPTELTVGMMGALLDAVSEFSGEGGAIGFSVFYYANEMYEKPNLKLLSVDGVPPSSKTIGDGSYPLLNDFYLVIKSDEPSDSPARRLRDWLLTADGKALLENTGYVPIN